MKARLLIIPAATALVVGAIQLSVNAEPKPKQPEALAQWVGCVQCHAGREVVKGPAYHDIAARYAHTPGARQLLIERVKNGSKGYWTEISNGAPMPPHRGRLTATDIETLVDWVLRQ